MKDKITSLGRPIGHYAVYDADALTPPWSTDRLRSVISCEIRSTQMRNYANVWVRRDDAPHCAYGKAEGYGCHRPSEALSVALMDLGCTHRLHGGSGEQAMEAALIAFAKELGVKRPLLEVINLR